MSETTSRGFPAPEILPEACQHEKERFYTVRLTAWERDLLQPTKGGVSGTFTLMALRDGTYELVVHRPA